MQESRTVRVFLSSTFRDFAEERDLLVRRVFPEIRRRARERNVEVIDVDLRWGITEQQAECGNVLPICLAEIERARPYFIGLLGERYGWIPESDQYDRSLLAEHPWLDVHKGGKSVTELEILHGVLNNPVMAGRAFFYFRDPDYAESRGGLYLSESDKHREKLNLLKVKIRESGFPLLEDYRSPEAVADRVLEDLWKVIDEEYPPEGVNDSLAGERRRHQSYAASRLGLYLGGEGSCCALDAAIEEDSEIPLLITGASGGGKSALLANWSSRYGERYPDAWVLVHFLGCSADASDPFQLVYRIEREIARLIGEEEKLDGNANKILQLFPEWLSLAGKFAERQGRKLIIVLDGMDKLSSRADLRWWPSAFPPHVKFVVSCLDGEIQSTLKRRMKWRELTVRPLDSIEAAELVRIYLARFNKTLPEAGIQKIVNHPLGGSPLFLRTVAEEMRVFGVHEELQERLDGYLGSSTFGELFIKVFERVEDQNRSDDLRSALSVIWGAFESFAEDELLHVSGLVPAVWLSILNELDSALISDGGRVAFGHDYVRDAVEERYVRGDDQKVKLMSRLADFCAQQMRVEGRKKNSSYVRRQAVRHFIHAKLWDEAVEALCDLEFIEARAKAKELSSMLGDHAAVLAALPETLEHLEANRIWGASMKRWAVDLAEYSDSCIRQRQKNASQPLLPVPPPAIVLKTKLELDRRRYEITEEPSQVDALMAFGRFIATHKTTLELFANRAGFLAQHAYNDAPSGPIHRAGARVLKANSAPRSLRRWACYDSYDPLNPCRAIFEDGLGEGVDHNSTALALSYDASFVVSSKARTIRVWDAASGDCLRVLEGHSDGISSVALSADASLAVSGSFDKTLRIWDVNLGACLRVFEGHSNGISSVALSADASLVVSGSFDETLRIWDLASGTCLRVLEGHSSWVHSVTLSADASLIISASFDCTLRVWDTITGTCFMILEGHLAPVVSAVISHDSTRAVSASFDGTVRVWDLASGKCIHVLKGHLGLVVTSVVISADASLAVSASADATLRVWDLNLGQCIGVLKGHSLSISSVAASADISRVASRSIDGTIRFWDLALAGSDRSSRGHLSPTSSVAISHDGESAISASGDRSILVWNLTQRFCGMGLWGRTRVDKLKGHAGFISSVAISPDDSFAVSASYDKTLRVWEIPSGICLRVLEGHLDRVTSVAISADNSFALSASLDNTLRVWDVASGICLRILEGHSGKVEAVTIAPNNSFALSVCSSTLRVWNLASGDCMHELEGHSAAAISPDNSFAVTAGNGGCIKVWDVASGNCVRVLNGSSGSVKWLAVSTDSSYVVSASRRTIVALNITSGTRLVTIRPKNNIGAIALHDKTLVVGNSAGIIEVYTLENFPQGPLVTTPMA